MSGNRRTTGNPGMRLILPLPGNETFARWLAEAGGWELGAIETRRFPDGETYVRVLSDVADRPVNLVCTLSRPDDGFLRLVFATDGPARSARARLRWSRPTSPICARTDASSLARP